MEYKDKSISRKEKQPPNTRARLLKTAVRLFSRHGYNGASVDKIVHAASVNKRMVYHYLGNKENLKQDTLLKLFFDSARRLFHSANP